MGKAGSGQKEAPGSERKRSSGSTNAPAGAANTPSDDRNEKQRRREGRDDGGHNATSTTRQGDRSRSDGYGTATPRQGDRNAGDRYGDRYGDSGHQPRNALNSAQDRNSSSQYYSSGAGGRGGHDYRGGS